jgi:hypothetical protein
MGEAVKWKMAEEGFPHFLSVQRESPESALQGERRAPFRVLGSDHRVRANSTCVEQVLRLYLGSLLPRFAACLSSRNGAPGL